MESFTLFFIGIYTHIEVPENQCGDVRVVQKYQCELRT